jgi:hypothetical protein
MTAVLPSNLQEYKYVSLYSTDTLQFAVHIAGVLADADVSPAMTVTFLDSDDAEIFIRAATHVSTGVYSVTFASSETNTPGYYKLIWSFSIGAVAQTFTSFLEIGQSSPAYDALPSSCKDVVESVWSRFSDLFDSPYGGPHLQVYFQSQFGRGRVAQAMNWALNRINAQSQPKMQSTLQTYPIGTWGAVLEQGTFVETIKHLRRSYVEQPEASGVSSARMDRRDYMARWGEIYAEEEVTFKEMLEVYKIRNMGLGAGRVLISGGVFGNYGPTQNIGSLAARPLFWARFY